MKKKKKKCLLVIQANMKLWGLASVAFDYGLSSLQKIMFTQPVFLLVESIGCNVHVCVCVYPITATATPGLLKKFRINFNQYGCP